MIFAELPKTKSLWYRVCFALITLTFLLAFAGCAINQPMTREVDLSVKAGGHTIEGLRFLISTNITLLRKYDKVIPDPLPEIPNVPQQPNLLRSLSTRDRIRLTAKTKGRLQRGDVNSGLYVSFEERGGTYPTIEFRQKNPMGSDEKFYLVYKTYPTGEQYITYEGEDYVVTYEGDEEPYLLYKRLEKEKFDKRKMPGLP
jgi:hypothetical protein